MKNGFVGFLGVSFGKDNVPMIILPFMANGNLRHYVSNPALQVGFSCSADYFREWQQSTQITGKELSDRKAHVPYCFHHFGTRLARRRNFPHKTNVNFIFIYLQHVD